MANTVPYEVLAAPFTLYIADVGETFPDVDTAPPEPDWTKIGTSGALNYDSDAGVTVEHRQSLNPWRSLGDAGSRKIFRSEEDFIIRMELVDVTIEQYRIALNRNALTDTAAGLATPGTRKVGLSRGFTVDTMALLVRGDISPYYADGAMQYEVPIAAQQGSPTVVYRKDQPAKLALEWMALVDPSQAAAEYFGRLVAQDSDSLS
jgi:hypothetical protein